MSFEESCSLDSPPTHFLSTLSAAPFPPPSLPPPRRAPRHYAPDADVPAGQEGHLSICEWLFAMSASADVTKGQATGRRPSTPPALMATSRCAGGCTQRRGGRRARRRRHPMFIATNGLPVAKWPLPRRRRHRTDDFDITPMLWACKEGHLWSASGSFGGRRRHLRPNKYDVRITLRPPPACQVA